MAAIPINLKEYIVFKRFMPDDSKTGFEQHYQIICEISLPAPVFTYSRLQIGAQVQKVGNNGHIYNCTIIKPSILSCGSNGEPTNVINLFVTDVDYTPHFASTPPLLFRYSGEIQKIGIILIATGKYHKFVGPLIEGAQKNLFPGHSLTYFVFTDKEQDVKLPNKNAKVQFIPWPHRPWPYPTLHRYKAIAQNEKLLKKMDYLYYCDVDMKIVGRIGNEALGTLVGTLHPGFIKSNNTKGTPERNVKSKAFIPINAPNKYYAGAFNGGCAAEFLTMAKILDNHIDADEAIGIIAHHNDESHTNWYFWKNKPTISLDAGYCYPEKSNLPYVRRMLALDKDHKSIRS